MKPASPERKERGRSSVLRSRPWYTCEMKSPNAQALRTREESPWEAAQVGRVRQPPSRSPPRPRRKGTHRAR
eukprot:scaffold257928_cov32-Tisochrysis_lutea.AAC.4